HRLIAEARPCRAGHDDAGQLDGRGAHRHVQDDGLLLGERHFAYFAAVAESLEQDRVTALRQVDEVVLASLVRDILPREADNANERPLERATGLRIGDDTLYRR